MRAFVSIACAVAVIGFTTPVFAQGKGAPKVKTTSGATATHGGASTHGSTSTHGSASTQGAASTHGKSATYKPAAPKTTTTTTTSKTTHAGGHGKTSAEKATGGAKTATTTTTAANAPSATTTTSTTTTSGTTLTPVQQKLQRNTTLASKLQSRLPAGTDLNTAAAGFRNLGQFVAAVNVSRNLGLDFTTLKTAMVTDGKSLGQAIQTQKGTTVEAHEHAVRAERDADTMIRASEKNASKPAGHGKQE